MTQSIHIEKAHLHGGGMHPCCIHGDTPVRNTNGVLYLAEDTQPGDKFDVWDGNCWVEATRVEMHRVRAEILIDMPVSREGIEQAIERLLSSYESVKVRILSQNPFLTKDEVLTSPCKYCGEPQNSRVVCGRCGRRL